ncbi:periplasmic heavy metal sensor [Brevundimonas sp.]|uniref:periplasmic heavy metal sensor n=1 Tax=Brevundimonas sp. TaxID=1871086 RepID=UPI002FC9B974
MASRKIKLALVASVALNVFLVAGGTAVWITARETREAERLTRTTRTDTLMEMVSTRSPDVAQAIEVRLREVAMAARPDFQEARAARRQAIALTASDDFDAVTVAGLLEQSRASETRGRARLESGAVEILNDQAPEDRKALARILSRYRPHSHSKTPPVDKGSAQPH